MKNIGIHAAMTLAEIGPVTDVVVFFNAVIQLLENGVPGSVYPWVTEKLYRRSLKQDELLSVKKQLGDIEFKFSRISPSDIDWLSLGLNTQNTRLDVNVENLSVMFKRVFSAFSEAFECSALYIKEFGEYIPVRLGVTDAPFSFCDINRLDSEYDALSEKEPPFWLKCR